MTEWRYLRAFAEHFARCGLVDGETVVVLSETQSRTALVDTARLAAQSIGARVFDVVVPTPASAHPVPIRSTGASQAIAGNASVIAALSTAGLVIDCTVEGLLHAPELGQILDGGARVLMISNESPTITSSTSTARASTRSCSATTSPPSAIASRTPPAMWVGA
jgi:2,5-dihydroxypyridine 5,6-dioxygenase